MQICRTCKENKSLTEYYRRKDTQRFFTECKQCANIRSVNNRERHRTSDPDSYYVRERKQRRSHYERNRNYYRSGNLEARYGISLEDYFQMYEEQDGKCCICKDYFPKGEERPRSNNNSLVVDHCHTSGEVRGLLCKPCNTGIGALMEKEENFLSAIDYLNKRKNG